MYSLITTKIDRKYQILISALEGGILSYGSIGSFSELCRILDISSVLMENYIYEEVGLSSDQLLDLYKD